jgi:zinc transporter, ZIP family
MTSVVGWSLLLCTGFVGGVIAIHRPLSIAVVDYLSRYAGEVLVAAIGIALLNTEDVASGEVVVGGGLIAGTVLAFVLISRTTGIGNTGSDRPSLLRLGIREVGLNAPEFLAIGILVAYELYIDTALLAAVYLTNIVQSISTTVALRHAGFSPSQIYIHWLAVSLCLVAIAMVSYLGLQDTSPAVQVSMLAVAAGGMHVSLSNAQPHQDSSRAQPGLLASLRFGLAFLTASLLSV